VKRGTRPNFTLVLRSGSTSPVHLIDVRRSRWHTFYAALKFFQGNKEVDLTAPISDPSAIPGQTDYFWLQPGVEARVKLQYEQDAGELRPGRYEAVVIFDSGGFESRKCLSTRAEFAVR
jgi:hypothetical protein